MRERRYVEGQLVHVDLISRNLTCDEDDCGGGCVVEGVIVGFPDVENAMYVQTLEPVKVGGCLVNHILVNCER